MDQLMNEVFAFYLDRLLGLNYVSPATISEFSGRRFKSVMDRPVIKQHWKRGDPMVCSEYLDDLEPAVWPAVFRKMTSLINVPDGETRGLSDSEKRDLETWGDVILVDYLTGNHDRLTVTLDTSHEGFGPRKNRKTQSISLSKCKRADCHVTNAFVNPKTGRLVLVDNNAGFFYDRAMVEPLSWILSDMCVFSSRMVRLLKKQDGDGFRKQLNLLVAQNEPEGPVQNGMRTRVFKGRYDDMMKHIQICEERYGRVSFFGENSE